MMADETKPGELPGAKYDVDERTRDQVERAFIYHPPKVDQLGRYSLIRDEARGLAWLIARACPSSREKSLALTKLEEAVMWANASIARNE